MPYTANVESWIGPENCSVSFFRYVLPSGNIQAFDNHIRNDRDGCSNKSEHKNGVNEGQVYLRVKLQAHLRNSPLLENDSRAMLSGGHMKNLDFLHAVL